MTADMHQRYTALYGEQTDTQTLTHSDGITDLQLSCKKGKNDTLKKYQ